MDKKEKREKIRKLFKQISEMPPEQRSELAAKMPIVNVESHALSVHNNCLLVLQAGNRPLTIVGGFKQWLSQGRVVKKGEHGMAIWFPSVKKNGNGETEEDEPDDKLRFMLGTVFDISQTVELSNDK